MRKYFRAVRKSNYMAIALSIVVLVGFMALSGCESKQESVQAKVYEGVIDLKAIDANKDGKVFQCPMDYNVLSDKAGTCPKCGMDIEEISIDQAKEVLTVNGFNVK